MKRSLQIILLLGLLLWVVACQNNATKNQDIGTPVMEDIDQVRPVVKVGVMTDYSPYIISSEDTLTGPYIEIVHTLMTQLDYEYELISLPWTRLISAVENGDIDFAIPFFDETDRHAIMDYEEIPIGFSQISVIGLEGVEVVFEGNFADLTEDTIGVVQDYFYSSEFAEAVEGGLINTEAAISTAQNIEKLLQGRIGLIVEDPEVVREYVAKNQITQNLVYMNEPIVVDYSHLVFTKARDVSVLRHSIHKAMEELKDSGLLFSIYEDYAMKDYGETFQELMAKEPPPVRFIQDETNTPLTIGVLGNTPPYVYYENEILTGFGIDLISEVFNRLGLAYAFEDLPFSRILEELKNGSLDVGIDLYKNPEREAFALYPDLPFAAYPTVIYKRKETDLNFTGNLEDLMPYTIGYIRDYSLGPLDPHIEDDLYNFVATDSPEQNMENLINGRVDIILDIKSTGDSLIESMGLTDVEALEPAIFYDFSYIVFSTDQDLQKLVLAYNRIIQDMFEDGSLERLSKQYDLPLMDIDQLSQ